MHWLSTLTLACSTRNPLLLYTLLFLALVKRHDLCGMLSHHRKDNNPFSILLNSKMYYKLSSGKMYLIFES